MKDFLNFLESKQKKKLLSMRKVVRVFKMCLKIQFKFFPFICLFEINNKTMNQLLR